MTNQQKTKMIVETTIKSLKQKGLLKEDVNVLEKNIINFLESFNSIPNVYKNEWGFGDTVTRKLDKGVEVSNVKKKGDEFVKFIKGGAFIWDDDDAKFEIPKNTFQRIKKQFIDVVKKQPWAKDVQVFVKLEGKKLISFTIKIAENEGFIVNEKTKNLKKHDVIDYMKTGNWFNKNDLSKYIKEYWDKNHQDITWRFDNFNIQPVYRINNSEIFSFMFKLQIPKELEKDKDELEQWDYRQDDHLNFLRKLANFVLGKIFKGANIEFYFTPSTVKSRGGNAVYTLMLNLKNFYEMIMDGFIEIK